MARHVTRVSCGHSAPALGAVQTRVNGREATWGTQDSYSLDVTRTQMAHLRMLIAVAQTCCLFPLA